MVKATSSFMGDFLQVEGYMGWRSQVCRFRLHFALRTKPQARRPPAAQ